MENGLQCEGHRGETRVEWGEDAEPEAGEVRLGGRGSGRGEASARTGSWGARAGVCGMQRGVESGKGCGGPRGPRSHCAEGSRSKLGELCVVRERQTEGDGRLNGDQRLPPLPPQPDWGKTGRGRRLPPLSPQSSAPPSTPNLFRLGALRTWGASRDPGTGALELGVAPPRAVRGCVRRGVRARVKGVGGFPLPPALGRKRKADFL